MHMYNFLCSDSLLYTSFFFFLLYMVFIHVIVHVIFQMLSCLPCVSYSAFASPKSTFAFQSLSCLPCVSYSFLVSTTTKLSLKLDIYQRKIIHYLPRAIIRVRRRLARIPSHIINFDERAESSLIIYYSDLQKA